MGFPVNTLFGWGASKSTTQVGILDLNMYINITFDSAGIAVLI